jgi:uncharacterized alkaline shock family protein YloU
MTGEHLENGTELGAVQIHQSVIATIARLSAMKIPGVVEMSGGLVDGLAGMIGKKSVDRGIRVGFEENSVTIELHVILEYGVRIPHVAWKIQTDVRQAVEQMTGKPVKSVQVVVQGVRLPATPEHGADEESA